MFFPQSESSSSLHASFQSSVDFSVWVLQTDGLCVPPFDQHTCFSGPLQENGLNQTNWTNWFYSLVREKSVNPVVAWKDIDSVGELLAKQWEIYLKQLQGTERAFGRLHLFIRELDTELFPYYTYLKPLNIFYVNYVINNGTFVQDHAVVLGIDQQTIDNAIFSSLLLSLTDQLAKSMKMPLDWQERQKQIMQDERALFASQIRQLPDEMQKQIAHFFPSFEKVPVTLLEFLNSRIKLFLLLVQEQEVEGVIVQRQMIASREYVTLKINDIAINVLAQEIQGATDTNGMVGGKVLIRRKETKNHIIDFNYRVKALL